MTERLQLGVVAAVHGIAGKVKVRSSIRDIKPFESVKEVFLLDDSENPKSFTLTDLSPTKNGLLISFKECTDVHQATQLIGRRIFVNMQQVEDLEDEAWWARDLIGLKVFSKSGILVGTIADILDINGSMLEIERTDKTKTSDTILIPFVKALVPVVDLANKRIEISDLEGLF